MSETPSTAPHPAAPPRRSPRLVVAGGLALLSLSLAAGCRSKAPDGGSKDAVSPPAAAAGAGSQAEAPPPADAEARHAARQALKAGRWEEAEPALLAAWRADLDADARIDGVLVAGSRSRRGDIDGALAVLTEAEAQSRSLEEQADIASAVADNIRDPVTVVERLRADGRNLITAPRAAMVARLLQRAGAVRDSADIWRIAERLDPDEPLYPRELARVCAQTGDAEGLEGALRRHLALAPEDMSSRVNLARLMQRTQGPEAAVTASLAPEGVLPDVTRHVLSGKVLLRLNLATQARAAFDAAVASSEEDHCESLYGQALAAWSEKPSPAAARLLWRLVEAPVAGAACHVVQSARPLLTDPDPKAARAARARMKSLVASKKTPDPEQLDALLDLMASPRAATPPAPRVIQPPPSPAPE